MSGFMGFQVWADVAGNLYCADGVVFHPATGTLIRVGSGNLFGETLPGVTGEAMRPFPMAPGATALGGSGRNLLTTGLTRELSRPDVPCGVFTAAEADTWRLGIFTLTKTGASTAVITDGTGTVAEMTSGSAPAGDYAGTSYGKSAYNSGLDFTITAAAETGTPLGIPTPVSVVTGGSLGRGDWTAVSASEYHLAGDAYETLSIASDGSAEISYDGTVIAVRTAGSAWNPEGVYVANEAGRTAYNSGADFNVVLTLPPLAPRAGYVYLEVEMLGGYLNAVNGPFFGSLPANSGDLYYVPVAQSDGAGGLEQFHLGMLVWPM